MLRALAVGVVLLWSTVAAAQPTPTEVKAKITEYSERSGLLWLVVDKGTAQGVGTTWTGVLLDKAGNPIKKGTITVASCTSDECILKAQGLTADQVSKNRDVKLKGP